MTRNGLHRLTLDDLDSLLALQAQTLPDTLSARLGSHFNTLYHRTMLGSDLFLADGYFAHGMLVGYLSYTENTVALLRSTLRDHVIPYGSAITLALLADPRRWGLVTRIARSVLGGAPGACTGRKGRTSLHRRSARVPRPPICCGWPEDECRKRIARACARCAA